MKFDDMNIWLSKDPDVKAGRLNICIVVFDYYTVLYDKIVFVLCDSTASVEAAFKEPGFKVHSIWTPDKYKTVKHLDEFEVLYFGRITNGKIRI